MFIINQNNNQHDGHIFIVLPSTIENPSTPSHSNTCTVLRTYSVAMPLLMPQPNQHQTYTVVRLLRYVPPAPV